MKIEKLMERFEPDFLAQERPMEYVAEDGGMVGIFRTIGCVGDSLASGEFESTLPDGTNGYHDYFDYSWGQYLARLAGVTARNFSRGGMTAKEYCDSYAQEQGWWDPALACDAYIIALGCNDLINAHQPLGTIADVHEDWNKNPRTFAGYYGQLISRLKQIQPDAKFFLMTFPNDEAFSGEEVEGQVKLMYDMAARFENTYVMDFYHYAPKYTKAFRERFFVGGHMSAAGYLLTAKFVASYMDYIIRHNMEDFSQAGFIGRKLRYVK